MGVHESAFSYLLGAKENQNTMEMSLEDLVEAGKNFIERQTKNMYRN